MAEVDSAGDLPQWPASAGDLPSGESPPPRQPWDRGLVAAAAYVLASGGYMLAFMSPNTSWEHHPFAGPLVALYESRHPAEFAISFAIWAGLGAGLCWPVFRPSVPAVAGAIASAVAWVALGVLAAAVASC